MKYKQAYHTPTDVIIRKMMTAKNPVTAASYRQILGNRIDRLEMHRLENKK